MEGGTRVRNRSYWQAIQVARPAGGRWGLGAREGLEGRGEGRRGSPGGKGNMRWYVRKWR